MNIGEHEMFTTYSNGKLLLAGEYLVLKGAWALAIPLRFGQKLQVSSHAGYPGIHWESISNGQTWVYVHFSTPSLEIQETNNLELANQIRNILVETKRLQPTFINTAKSLKVEASLNFPHEWGIGSGSSFIVNIARWSGCDPFALNNRIFSGSGYDIATAASDKPIIYRLDNSNPIWKEVTFYPPFIDKLWLVYQNKKQNTLKSIRKFEKIPIHNDSIEAISSISIQMSEEKSLQGFMSLMDIHERHMAEILRTNTIQQTMFPDFRGSIKSLGAWGGDFLMAVSEIGDDYVPRYFEEKGFNTYFRMNDMILT